MELGEEFESGINLLCTSEADESELLEEDVLSGQDARMSRRWLMRAKKLG